MISLERLLLSQDQPSAKKLLFVGECTHLFSAAAAELVRVRRPHMSQLDWWSTELQWPSESLQVGELRRSRERLESLGVVVREGVDATRLHLANLKLRIRPR
eukprot:1096995-Amphidinium_carterae.1